MGLLVDGKWVDRWYATKESGGRFVRNDAAFRNWVTEDGSAGPSGQGGFKAEAGRYHLYVSLACPWAHRTLIFRALLGLEKAIDISVVNHFMGEQGWTFEPGEGVIPDPINGASLVHQIYTAAMPTYTGRVTVPILWDKKLKTIASNESSEIIRMFNGPFRHLGEAQDAPADLYPENLHAEIDSVNERVYHAINNGVYMCGFATTQHAYDEAVAELFAALDEMEARLAKTRYLCGDRITEADWRLFTTLVRFEQVYHFHFKCNRRRLRDYPNLWGFTRELYQVSGVAETVNMDHITRHYFGSHETINPHRIVPVGPDIDFAEPHGRA